MVGDDDTNAAHPLTGGGWRKLVEVPLIAIGTLTVFIMMFVSVADALLRTFLDKPIFGANDYTIVLLSFIVPICLPLCVLAGKVIAIDTLVGFFPKRLGTPINWVITIIGAGSMAYLAWRAFINAQQAARFGETTMLLQLPLGPSYYAIAFGSALSAFLLLTERLSHER